MNNIEIKRTTAPSKTYSVGQMFVDKHNRAFILAEANLNRLAMINLTDGRAIGYRIKAENWPKVTASELMDFDPHFFEMYEAAEVNIKLTVTSEDF